MLRNFIKNYYKLFDEKLQNGTIIVLIIAFLISSIGNVTNAGNKSELYVKANILETRTTNEVIIINGKTYQLID
ncbi:MAG: hypothetical protein PHI37_01610 [Candidatus Gracilibacteria bacterium]|nr:hypothetical protein [Candidatus Gracilibacteria bacterium]